MLIRERNARLYSIPLAVVAALALAASTSAADFYQVTDLGTLSGDFCAGFVGKNSFATALNDDRQVVGGSCAFVGFFQRVTHAFSWSEGAMTDIGTLGLASPDQSTAHGINNAGQVVGRSFVGDAGGIAFLWSGGTMTSLDSVLGPGFSSALDINNAGQIVGLRGVPPDVSSWSAFLYDTTSGAATSLPGLSDPFRSAGVAINDAGDVAGYATAATNVFHAVRWRSQLPTDLGTLGGTHSFASGINGAGDVVGQSWMSGDSNTHAFLHRDGVLQDLGTLGGGHSWANGINDSGQVVGLAGTASNESHAFIFEDGLMADLNDRIQPSSGWVLIEATAINSSDEIVGTGRINNETHGFLLSPSSPPTDTMPPVLSVPADFTIEATDPAGAFVSYVVTAVDDVDPHPTVACVPPSGSTFPVGTTTVECVATDNTGKSASATFNVTVVPPIDIALALAKMHQIDAKTGIVTIEGSIACNRDAFVFISGQLTERVAQRAMLQGSFGTAVACVAPVAAWSAVATADIGRFGFGPAEAHAFAFSCGLSCDSDEKSESVLLVGGHR